MSVDELPVLNLTAFDIVAIVGAAAWMPQVVRFVFWFFIKPNLKVIFGATSQVGYTSYGPILNLNCAFSVSGKDGVIENMKIELKHEKGHTFSLDWQFLNETLSQIVSPAGATAEVEKRQPATALKIYRTVLTEKLIGFQSSDFLRDQLAHATVLLDLLELTRTNRKAEEVPDVVLQSKEYNEYIEYHRRQFFWKDGRYEGILSTKLLGISKPGSTKFSFSLSAKEVNRLEKNLSTIEMLAKYTIDQTPIDQKKQEPWIWVNPQLNKEN